MRYNVGRVLLLVAAARDTIASTHSCGRYIQLSVVVTVARDKVTKATADKPIQARLTDACPREVFLISLTSFSMRCSSGRYPSMRKATNSPKSSSSRMTCKTTTTASRIGMQAGEDRWATVYCKELWGSYTAGGAKMCGCSSWR